MASGSASPSGRTRARWSASARSLDRTAADRCRERHSALPASVRLRSPRQPPRANGPSGPWSRPCPGFTLTVLLFDTHGKHETHALPSTTGHVGPRNRRSGAGRRRDRQRHRGGVDHGRRHPGRHGVHQGHQGQEPQAEGLQAVRARQAQGRAGPTRTTRTSRHARHARCRPPERVRASAVRHPRQGWRRAQRLHQCGRHRAPRLRTTAVHHEPGAEPGGPAQPLLRAVHPGRPREESAARCTGNYTNPTPTAGTLCVYPVSTDNDNVTANQAQLYPGSAINGDAAESNGFYVYVVSAAAGNMEFRYVWAYLAP